MQDAPTRVQPPVPPAGDQPPAFVFPFEEAERPLTDYRDLLDQLRLIEIARGELEEAIDQLRLLMQQAAEAREQRGWERRLYAHAAQTYARQRAAYLDHPRRNPLLGAPPVPDWSLP